jgi:hypothetical protein
MCFAELAQSRRHKAVDGSDADSDAQASRFTACRRPGGVEERVEIADNAASLAVEELSGCRKSDIAPAMGRRSSAPGP